MAGKAKEVKILKYYDTLIIFIQTLCTSGIISRLQMYHIDSKVLGKYITALLFLLNFIL